jgi:hypothetical protein
MHAWEWLALPCGRLLKTDAVDHHAAHDLVGCQDIAWDVAGAHVELGLPPASLDTVLRALADSGRSVCPDLLALFVPCYCAFQLGQFTMALQAEHDSAERARLSRTVARYRGRLMDALLAPLAVSP